MRIHQISANYRFDQDRILLRINTDKSEELLVWLTRRLLGRLWPLLNRLHREHLLHKESSATTLQGADDGLKKMLTDFRKEELLRTSDFGTPYQGAASHPLGPEPLLVSEVEVKSLGQGRLRLGFTEKPADDAAKPRNFQIDIEPKLMQGFIHLLEQAVAKSQWAGPFEAAETKPAPAPAAPDAGDRPRYLN